MTLSEAVAAAGEGASAILVSFPGFFDLEVDGEVINKDGVVVLLVVTMDSPGSDLIGTSAPTAVELMFCSLCSTPSVEADVAEGASFFC